MRVERVEISERGCLDGGLTVGTGGGGALELASLRVSEFDGLGKIQRIDVYDPDQLDQARARFDELCAAREDSAG